MTVRVWNKLSEDLWGLRADEVAGQHFLGLDIGLPVASLSEQIRAALSSPDGMTEVRLAAVNRRGKGIECTVRVSPLGSDGEVADGVILLVDG
jgi:two-component system CheB/CheR fusion protein